MKKLLLVLTLVLTIFLTGCVETVEQSAFEDAIDSLNTQIAELELELVEQKEYITDANIVIAEQELKISDNELLIESLQPDKYDRFIKYTVLTMFGEDGEAEFLELDLEYNITVDAYGYSKEYIYEVTEETVFEIFVDVNRDIDIEYCYAPTECTIETVTPTLLNTFRKYTFTASEGYIIISFESWDEYDDSEVTFIVTAGEII